MRRLSEVGCAAMLALAVCTPVQAQDTTPTERAAPLLPDADGNYLPDPTQDVPLNEAELLAAFTDKTHRGTYTFQRRNIETFAFVETTTADGRTVHRHGDKTDRGSWRVRANVICFDYEDWDAVGGRHLACFNIYRRGNCYYHYGLGGGGNFTARSVHAGEQPNCEPGYV